MKIVATLALLLVFGLFFLGGCVTTSQEVHRVQRADIEHKCRIQLGWDDPICASLDDDAVESIGAGGVFP
jgi:hypothetical protein